MVISFFPCIHHNIMFKTSYKTINDMNLSICGLFFYFVCKNDNFPLLNDLQYYVEVIYTWELNLFLSHFVLFQQTVEYMLSQHV
jgi:hypothetical protein